MDPARIGATGESYGGGVSLELATLKDRVMNADGTLSPWQSPAGTPLHISAAAPVIPWSDPACLDAATVHLGGTLDEIAAGEASVWRGEHPDKPFAIVVQSSLFDPTRAPAGKHTA